MINSSSNDNILELSKLQAFANDKVSVTQKLNFGVGWWKTLWGKERCY